MKESRTVVLSGGAGYIGRCTAEILRQAGYSPVALDNFSTSPRVFSPDLPCHEVDLRDLEATRAALQKIGDACGIIHFAAKAIVSESCDSPETYFRNNLLATLNLAQVAAELGLQSFIHSSSCAVYGVPEVLPMSESLPLHPLSPYGETKLISEQILHHMSQYRGLRVLNLRYFNPAGALPAKGLGENHSPENHLVPNIVRALMHESPLSVFGTDYATPDGTCIRDFIHIEDLAKAHLAALKYLKDNPSLSEDSSMWGLAVAFPSSKRFRRRKRHSAERSMSISSASRWGPTRALGGYFARNQITGLVTQKEPRGNLPRSPPVGARPFGSHVKRSILGRGNQNLLDVWQLGDLRYVTCESGDDDTRRTRQIALH